MLLQKIRTLSYTTTEDWNHFVHYYWRLEPYRTLLQKIGIISYTTTEDWNPIVHYYRRLEPFRTLLQKIGTLSYSTTEDSNHIVQYYRRLEPFRGSIKRRCSYVENCMEQSVVLSHTLHESPSALFLPYGSSIRTNQPTTKRRQYLTHGICGTKYWTHASVIYFLFLLKESRLTRLQCSLIVSVCLSFWTRCPTLMKLGIEVMTLEDT
jgi:hypothetical protein